MWKWRNVDTRQPAAASPVSQMPLQLQFADSPAAQYALVKAAMAEGARTLRVEPATAMPGFAAALDPESKSEIRFVTAHEAPADLVVIPVWNDDEAATALLRCAGIDSGRVIAPVTAYHQSKRSLFLITIPKAGTHLLFRLVEALGYARGGVASSDPLPGKWYSIEHQVTHMRATDMFRTVLERDGNLDHPFLRSPALFIYRDPRDIIVSEANYNHRPEVSFTYGFYAGMSFRERLIRLIDDPWLFGSIRDRMGAYIPWLDLPNVIPVSFEELVGAAGGGDDSEQRRLIWSVQLKLQVAGRPDLIAKQLYDRTSPTFHTGKIGGWRQHFDRDILRLFARQPNDFMVRLGYDPDGKGGNLPIRREAFRRRPLQIDNSGFIFHPNLVECNVNGCNIVRYRRRFFALPLSLGPVDLEAWPEARLNELLSDTTLPALRQTLSSTPVARQPHIIGADLDERIRKHFGN